MGPVHPSGREDALILHAWYEYFRRYLEPRDGPLVVLYLPPGLCGLLLTLSLLDGHLSRRIGLKLDGTELRDVWVCGWTIRRRAGTAVRGTGWMHGRRADTWKAVRIVLESRSEAWGHCGQGRRKLYRRKL